MAPTFTEYRELASIELTRSAPALGCQDSMKGTGPITIWQMVSAFEGRLQMADLDHIRCVNERSLLYTGSCFNGAKKRAISMHASEIRTLILWTECIFGRDLRLKSELAKSLIARNWANLSISTTMSERLRSVSFCQSRRRQLAVF